MHSFINTSGTISCPTQLGIYIRGVQVDTSDTSATVYVTLSGIGTSTVYTFSALSPVVPDIRFPKSTNVYISSSGTMNNVIINYILYGDQGAYTYAEAAGHGYTPIPARFR